MDAIDIRDTAFSLDIPDTNEVINMSNDYNIFIYMGAAILIVIIGMFIYKFYINKTVNKNQQNDCEGGFCTMNGNTS